MNLKKLLSQPQYDPIRDKKAERNLFARRALVSFIGVLVLSAVLILNLYDLQVVNYDSYQTRTTDPRLDLRSQRAIIGRKFNLFRIICGAGKSGKFRPHF